MANGGYSNSYRFLCSWICLPVLPGHTTAFRKRAKSFKVCNNLKHPDLYDVLSYIFSDSRKASRQILCQKDNCLGRFHLFSKLNWALFFSELFHLYCYLWITNCSWSYFDGKSGNLKISFFLV